MPRVRLKRTMLTAVTGALVAAVPALASAGAPATGERLPDSKRMTIAGVNGPGPDRYDKQWVRKYGPRRPDCVMVMVPGSPAGQGGFGWLGGVLSRHVDGLAVWALDRRSNGLEDVSAFRNGSADDAFGYYFAGAPFGGRSFEPVSAEQAPFARRWGAKLALRDLRRVVRKANEASGGCVILGGHSFGALQVPAYAVWDFNGRPGFRDLDGIVLVDGGLFNAFGNLLSEDGFPPFTDVAQARARIEALRTGDPFGSDEGGDVPEWQVGVVPELVCDYALSAPAAPSVLQQRGFAPFVLTDPPAFPVTNAAFAGLFNDQSLGEQGARLGRLAPSGNPRPWLDGRHSGVARFCATFAQEPGNGMEWYFPVRLEIDLAQGMEQMRPTPVTRYLGLRPAHLAELDTPLYVLQTMLSDGGVLRAARKLVRKSRIENPKLVDASNMRHYDPLMDVPSENRFLRSVTPFLERIVTRSESRGRS